MPPRRAEQTNNKYRFGKSKAVFLCLLLICSEYAAFIFYCPVRAALTFVGCDKSKQKRAFGPSWRSAVAVNFSASAVIKGVTFLPLSRRRSACNVPTNGKIHITTALPEGKAHGQLYLKISSTNESATSIVFIKIRNRLIFSCYSNRRVPDIRNPLAWVILVSSVLRGCTDGRGLKESALYLQNQNGRHMPSVPDY